MTWTVNLTRRAGSDLERIDEKNRRVIIAAVRSFAAGARLDVKKLRGLDAYRLRVGRFRVLYELVDSTILVLRVLDRKDAY